MLISEKNRAAIKERFQEMENRVVFKFFETSFDCDTCGDVKQLLGELCEISELLTLQVHNLYIDEEQAKNLNIDKAPTIVLTDETGKDYGIRFYGTPSGYEFATLLEDILMISKRDSGLQDDTRKKLSALTSPVSLTVFVTPTCPYCPAAVRLAHQFAYESPLVGGSMVMANEFSEWANRFEVYGVPKTIVNDANEYSLEGAAPEKMLLEKVLAAVDAS